MSSKFFSSSIGRKLLMGSTGLFLCSFLVVHFVGNLLLFKNDGGVAFDQYSVFMSSNVIIRTIEIGLFAGFIFHIVLGVKLWLANRSARPVRYALNKPGESSTLASRIGFLSGSVVFMFLVIHLKTFFIPARFGVYTSMYVLVREAFSSPAYVLFYVVAMVLLGYHLRHGFQSAFQTFGILDRKYAPLFHSIGFLFWFILPLGFAAMPVFFLFWIH